jgi:hypothetical protein
MLAGNHLKEEKSLFLPNYVYLVVKLLLLCLLTLLSCLMPAERLALFGSVVSKAKNNCRARHML